MIRVSSKLDARAYVFAPLLLEGQEQRFQRREPVRRSVLLRFMPP
jgi:hypothetical protein